MNIEINDFGSLKIFLSRKKDRRYHRMILWNFLVFYYKPKSVIYT